MNEIQFENLSRDIKNSLSDWNMGFMGKGEFILNLKNRITFIPDSEINEAVEYLKRDINPKYYSNVIDEFYIELNQIINIEPIIKISDKYDIDLLFNNFENNFGVKRDVFNYWFTGKGDNKQLNFRDIYKKDVSNRQIRRCMNEIAGYNIPYQVLNDIFAVKNKFARNSGMSDKLDNYLNIKLKSSEKKR